MINYNKLIQKMRDKGITTYTIRQNNIFGQELLRKIKMCSVTDAEREAYGDIPDKDIITMKLHAYEVNKGKPFLFDVSTKTIEELCQLLQCQPYEIMDWEVELDEEKSFEKKYK